MWEIASAPRNERRHCGNIHTRAANRDGRSQIWPANAGAAGVLN
jgi:hypothetical protein